MKNNNISNSSAPLWLSGSKVLDGDTSEVNVSDVLNTLVSHYCDGNSSSVQLPSTYTANERKNLKFYLFEILLSHRKDSHTQLHNGVNSFERVTWLACKLAFSGCESQAKTLDSCLQKLESKGCTSGSTTDSILSVLVLLSKLNAGLTSLHTPHNNAVYSCIPPPLPPSTAKLFSIQYGSAATNISVCSLVSQFTEYPEHYFNGELLEHSDKQNDNKALAWSFLNNRSDAYLEHISQNSGNDQTSLIGMRNRGRSLRSNSTCGTVRSSSTSQYHSRQYSLPGSPTIPKAGDFSECNYRSRRRKIANKKRPTSGSKASAWLKLCEDVPGSGINSWLFADDEEAAPFQNCLGAATAVLPRRLSPTRTRLAIPTLPQCTLVPTLLFPSQHFNENDTKGCCVGSSDEGYDSSQGSGQWLPSSKPGQRKASKYPWAEDYSTRVWEVMAQNKMDKTKKTPPTWLDYRNFYLRKSNKLAEYNMGSSKDLPPLIEAGPKATHMIWYSLKERWCSLRPINSINTGVPPLSVLPMHLLCQHIVYATIGIPSHSFIYIKATGTFHPLAGVCYEGITPEAIKPILVEYASTATLFRKLECLCESFYGAVLPSQDATGGAFITALREILHSIRGQVLQILKRSRFLEVHFALQGFVTRIKFLGNLCHISEDPYQKQQTHSKSTFDGNQCLNDSQVTAGKTPSSIVTSKVQDHVKVFPGGLELLGELLNALQLPCPDPCTQLLLSLLAAAIAPFFRSLERWVMEGIPNSSVVSVNSEAVERRDSTFLKAAFSVPLSATRHLPPLFKDLLHRALKAGTEMYLLRLCQPKHPLLHELSCAAPHLQLCTSVQQLQDVEQQCSRYSAALQQALHLSNAKLELKRQLKEALYKEQKEAAALATEKAELNRQKARRLKVEKVRREQAAAREELDRCVRNGKRLRAEREEKELKRQEQVQAQYELQATLREQREQSVRSAVEDFYKQVSVVTLVRDTDEANRREEEEVKLFAAGKEESDSELDESEGVEAVDGDDAIVEEAVTDDGASILNNQVTDDCNANTVDRDEGRAPTEVISLMSTTSDLCAVNTPMDVECLPDLPSDEEPTHKEDNQQDDSSSPSTPQKSQFTNWRQFSQDGISSQYANNNDAHDEAQVNRQKYQTSSIYEGNSLGDTMDKEGNELPLIRSRGLSKDGHDIKRKIMLEEFNLDVTDDVRPANVDDVNANITKEVNTNEHLSREQNRPLPDTETSNIVKQHNDKNTHNKKGDVVSSKQLSDIYNETRAASLTNKKKVEDNEYCIDKSVSKSASLQPPVYNTPDKIPSKGVSQSCESIKKLKCTSESLEIVFGTDTRMQSSDVGDNGSSEKQISDNLFKNTIQVKESKKHHVRAEETSTGDTKTQNSVEALNKSEGDEHTHPSPLPRYTLHCAASLADVTPLDDILGSALRGAPSRVTDTKEHPEVEPTAPTHDNQNERSAKGAVRDATALMSSKESSSSVTVAVQMPQDGQLSAIPVYLLRALSAVINTQVSVCGESVVLCLLTQHHLVDHLTSIRHWLLLQDAAFAYTLTAALMRHQCSGRSPSSVLTPVVLNSVLSEALSEAMRGHTTQANSLSFVLKDAPPPSFTHSSVVTSFVKLMYHVSWPCCLVLTPKHLSAFSRVSGLLLNVSAALNAADTVFTVTMLQGRSYGRQLCRSPQYHAVCLYRHQFAHTIRVLYSYLMNQVMSICGTEDQAVDSMTGDARSLEQLTAQLSVTAEALLKRCFLNTKAAPVLILMQECCSLVHLFKAQLSAHHWTNNKDSKHFTHAAFSALQQTHTTFQAKTSFLCKLLEGVLSVHRVMHVEELVTALDYSAFYI